MSGTSLSAAWSESPFSFSTSWAWLSGLACSYFCLPFPPHPGLQPGLTGFFLLACSFLPPHLSEVHIRLLTHTRAGLGSPGVSVSPLAVLWGTVLSDSCCPSTEQVQGQDPGNEVISQAELGPDMGQVSASTLNVLSLSLWAVEATQSVSTDVQELELRKGTSVSPSED